MVKHRSMSMSKRRTMRRKHNMSMGKSRSMRRYRTMRGGKLSGDSSYSTSITGSSDNSSYLPNSSGAYQQNIDRNNSSINGEGGAINMSAAAFKGLIPPQGYSGGKRRRMRMRGGESDKTGMFMVDDSEAMRADKMITEEQLNSVSGGRRRRRMRGGDSSSPDVPGALDSSAIMTNPSTTMSGGRRRRRMRMRGGSDVDPNAPMNPDLDAIDMSGGKRRSRRMSMRGGMYDNDLNADVVNPMGGARRRSRSKARSGGGIIATAALPFGLFGLQKYFQGRKRHTRRY
jgi:hypothetical protein